MRDHLQCTLVPTHTPLLTGTAQNAGLLADESKKYRKKTKDLYHQALLRKYLPLAVLVGIVVLVLWIRWYFY